MTDIYHVTVPVIGFVEAESEDEAVKKLTRHIERDRALTVYDGEEPVAFVSEPLVYGERVIR